MLRSYGAASLGLSLKPVIYGEDKSCCRGHCNNHRSSLCPNACQLQRNNPKKATWELSTAVGCFLLGSLEEIPIGLLGYSWPATLVAAQISRS